MGFWIMLFSFFFGIFLTILGISRRKDGAIFITALVIGIALILFGVYLALPK
ncbi:hypothetical protein ACSBRB_04250 [Staphylococcus auricularis]|uniref:hypothetical protein n=1 Tax=Staphylococcus auricularis TaxID=29379 RepID=UPI003EBE61D7